MIFTHRTVINLTKTDLQDVNVVQQLRRDMLNQIIALATIKHAGPIYFKTAVHKNDPRLIEIEMSLSIITEDNFNEAKELILKLRKKGVSEIEIKKILDLLK